MSVSQIWKSQSSFDWKYKLCFAQICKKFGKSNNANLLICRIMLPVITAINSALIRSKQNLFLLGNLK